jgi:hypothetical protein
LRLSSPDSDINFNDSETVVLNEPPDCTPPELIEFDADDDDEIKEMRRKLSEGDSEDIVDTFDVAASCSLAKPDSVDAEECQLLLELDKNMAGVSSVDEKRDIVCDSMVSRIASILESPPDPNDGTWYSVDVTPEGHRQKMKRGVYLEALTQSVGLMSRDGDEEEAIFRCMMPHYKNPAACEPCASDEAPEAAHGSAVNEDEPTVEDERSAEGGSAAE